jgi:hypothetical protein
MTAIPPPVQTVLDLFTTHLPEVRFGDLDAQSLARAAEEVQVASDVAAAAQGALESARVVLHERQEALLSQVQRALAYARVFAEADEALSARLEAVALPRAARRPRADASASASGNDALVLTPTADAGRRPRGRPRKSPLAPVSASTATEEPMMLEGLAAAGE